MKLGDVVTAARLDPITAKYVLRTQGLLRDMPGAGSQGRHRHFTVDQALRLAFCTRLVMSGLELRVAADVVDYCESAIRAVRRSASKPSQGKPWTVMLVDNRYLQLLHGDKVVSPGAKAFKVLGEDATVAELPDPFIIYTLNLSLLRSELEKAADLFKEGS